MKMIENKQFRCVNCGEPSNALYRTYGPSVLKLTKCENCKGIVDKYIEYDPVIVMIDLVLMSKEAQRHILYNTDFKAFWKLFIIMTMLETYAVWSSDSLFLIIVNTICNIPSNYTINSLSPNIPVHISVPDTWKDRCRGWRHERRGDDIDLFIWEKDFYVQFISTLLGVLVFISTVHCLMQLVGLVSIKNRVSGVLVCKALSLSLTSGLFALPTLVWSSAETSPETRFVHYSLVHVYNLVIFTNVFTVLYGSPTPVTTAVIVASNCAKYLTTFHATPIIRELIT